MMKYTDIYTHTHTHTKGSVLTKRSSIGTPEVLASLGTLTGVGTLAAGLGQQNHTVSAVGGGITGASGVGYGAYKLADVLGGGKGAKTLALLAGIVAGGFGGALGGETLAGQLANARYYREKVKQEQDLPLKIKLTNNIFDPIPVSAEGTVRVRSNQPVSVSLTNPSLDMRLTNPSVGLLDAGLSGHWRQRDSDKQLLRNTIKSLIK